MIKADDKVEYEFSEKPENFTHFEELQKKVEILIETIDEHAEILRQNGLLKKEETEAPDFDEDKVYRRLEEE